MKNLLVLGCIRTDARPRCSIQAQTPDTGVLSNIDPQTQTHYS